MTKTAFRKTLHRSRGVLSGLVVLLALTLTGQAEAASPNQNEVYRPLRPATSRSDKATEAPWRIGGWGESVTSTVDLDLQDALDDLALARTFKPGTVSVLGHHGPGLMEDGVKYLADPKSMYLLAVCHGGMDGDADVIQNAATELLDELHKQGRPIRPVVAFQHRFGNDAANADFPSVEFSDLPPRGVKGVQSIIRDPSDRWHPPKAWIFFRNADGTKRARQVDVRALFPKLHIARGESAVWVNGVKEMMRHYTHLRGALPVSRAAAVGRRLWGVAGAELFPSNFHSGWRGNIASFGVGFGVGYAIDQASSYYGVSSDAAFATSYAGGVAADVGFASLYALATGGSVADAAGSALSGGVWAAPIAVGLYLGSAAYGGYAEARAGGLSYDELLPGEKSAWFADFFAKSAYEGVDVAIGEHVPNWVP